MILTRLAKLLRVAPGDVEDVLRNDHARARDTVTRRRFMGAAAALSTAAFVPVVYSIGCPHLTLADYLASIAAAIEVRCTRISGSLYEVTMQSWGGTFSLVVVK